jgi:hypothetical protein
MSGMGFTRSGRANHATMNDGMYAGYLARAAGLSVYSGPFEYSREFPDWEYGWDLCDEFIAHCFFEYSIDLTTYARMHRQRLADVLAA